MKKNIFFCLSLFFLYASNLVAQKLSYTLSVSKPHTHYVEVSVKIEGIKKDFIDFKMPVWAPGSYLVREFSKNVEGESAEDASGKALPLEKVRKNTWRITTNKSETVSFSYKVYAYEVSVRTSFIDAAHAHLVPTSIFVYPDGMLDLPSTIQIKTFADWKEISTGLAMIGNDKFMLSSPNYDVLADSPIELGNQKIYDFTADNIPHKIAVYGGGNYNEDNFTKDVAKVTETATKIFGENPCKDYTFIINNVGSNAGNGGLEHLNSTSLVLNRFNYNTPTGYVRFLELVAHEYFHLWNVKRLRPQPLGPFDYDNENYTRQLWISEGFTSYYQEVIVRRAGFTNEFDFLNGIASEIDIHENSPGGQVQSITESSYDAWIKGYRPNENSRNTGISYYGSGARVAAILDLIIIQNSKGKHGLDDVMKFAYQEYYKKLNRGFTEDEFKKALEKFAGIKLDDFFKKHVYGTEKPDYNLYYGYAGLQLNESKSFAVDLGASIAEENNRLMIKAVTKGESAYEYGLNVNDEILAIDNFRMGNRTFMAQYLQGKKRGDKIKVLVARDMNLQTIEVVLMGSNANIYSLSRVPNPSESQQLVYNKWLSK
ncbi:MAG: M61 family peptidase [Bacteroidetes bacterium]|nr:MAG: M61 family peptidase [Bacteroidota bacterium]